MSTRRSSVEESDFRKLKELERPVAKIKHGSGGIRIHLVYPNSYWVAMSNLGFQAVYSLLSEQDDISVERAYLPEHWDDEKVFAKNWKTFESSRPLADCDILAFSLSFETDYPHLARILRNAGLLTRTSSERDEMRGGGLWGAPLILAGGTAVTLNPEPGADFLDLAMIGEAEEFIPEFVSALKKGKVERTPRLDLLKQLSRIEGLYVPRFYTPQFNADDSVKGYLVDREVTPRPKRRFVKDLSKFPTYSRILTPETEFKSMFLTETGRGCEMGCRFCVAGYIYRPIRKRSEESIADTVKIGLENSQAVGFVGASVSSHKSIAKLAHSVAEKGARASLSSLMSQRVTRELAASLSESEYKTVALAPEAGSERLRRAAGKRVPNAQIIQAAVALAEAGIRGFKLYFIVGLPTEMESDVDAIATLATTVRNAVSDAAKGDERRPWVQLSVNPFIPKASTPFQWEPMLDLKVLDKKIERVHELIKRVPNLEMRFESPKESYFQALLSRGDRRVAAALFETEVQGKDWKWLLQQAKKGSFDGVPPLSFYVTRHIPFEERLPWEVIDSRIERSLLQREAMRAREGERNVETAAARSELPASVESGIAG